MQIADCEPLLPDDRIGKIHDLLRIAFPELPFETEVVSFMVPPQQIVKDNGQIVDIPAQAVFSLVSDNPRGSFDPIYRGKRVLTSGGMPLDVWEADARLRKHFVSSREDPAWKFFAYAARVHLDRLKNYRELI